MTKGQEVAYNYQHISYTKNTNTYSRPLLGPALALAYLFGVI